MLKRKHGEQKFSEYQKRNEPVVEKAECYNKKTTQGNIETIYDL